MWRKRRHKAKGSGESAASTGKSRLWIAERMMANSLKSFFSHSLVFFSVISVANSAARMLFLSSFDMRPLVCEPSILVSFLLHPQDAPVSPRLIFFITVQAERSKREGFSSCCDICFCFSLWEREPSPTSVLFSSLVRTRSDAKF